MNRIIKFLEFFVRLYIRKRMKYLTPKRIADKLTFLVIDEDLKKE